MLKQSALRGLALFMGLCIILGPELHLMVAQTRTQATGNLAALASSTSAAVNKEVMNAALAHQVKVQADRAVVINEKDFTLVHVPLQGIEKYKQADFIAGVPIMLILVRRAGDPGGLNGSYVVKAQFAAGASTGKAFYLDSKGAVAAQRELLIGSSEPFPFSETPRSSEKENRAAAGGIVKGTGPQPTATPTPVDIPVITSTGCQHPYGPNDKTCYVDCAGWQPYQVLYFPT